MNAVTRIRIPSNNKELMAVFVLTLWYFMKNNEIQIPFGLEKNQRFWKKIWSCVPDINEIRAVVKKLYIYIYIYIYMCVCVCVCVWYLS